LKAAGLCDQVPGALKGQITMEMATTAQTGFEAIAAPAYQSAVFALVPAIVLTAIAFYVLRWVRNR